MLKVLKLRFIDHFAKRYGYDTSYMKMMLETSPKGFGRFFKMMGVLNHREAVGLAPLYAAKLTGTVAEDCGPCTQLVADMAHAAGMPALQLSAVLRSDMAAMDEDVRLAVRFARAAIAASADLDDLREQVRARWGDKGVLELTFAAQMSRVIPMVKLGLGYAAECRQVKVEGEPLWIRRQAA